MDFGLAREVDSNTQTSVGGVEGTPAFMAPEVILEGSVDARADIYSLGCVAYYLLTGELVFEADTPMKMFVQHLQAEPIPPSQRGELPIPMGLERLVLACLAKDPELRPQSIDEVVRRLDAVTDRISSALAPTFAASLAPEVRIGTVSRYPLSCAS